MGLRKLPPRQNPARTPPNEAKAEKGAARPTIYRQNPGRTPAEPRQNPPRTPAEPRQTRENANIELQRVPQMPFTARTPAEPPQNPGRTAPYGGKP